MLLNLLTSHKNSSVCNTAISFSRASLQGPNLVRYFTSLNDKMHNMKRFSWVCKCEFHRIYRSRVVNGPYMLPCFKWFPNMWTFGNSLIFSVHRAVGGGRNAVYRFSEASRHSLWMKTVAFTHFACYSLSRFVLFNHGSVFTRSCEKHEQVVIFFSFCYLLPQPQRANTLAHTSPPCHGQITFSFHQSGGSSRTINPTGDAVRGSRNEQQ